MPNYKLIYFNMRGRAEIIRYIFAYLDIKYEDHRIEQADWPKIKPTLPFGKIPVLEVGGLTLHQSLAIARYLAKNTDLAGKTELEQCQADAVVDTLDDFMSLFPWAEKNQDVKDPALSDPTARGRSRPLDVISSGEFKLFECEVQIYGTLLRSMVRAFGDSVYRYDKERTFKELLTCHAPLLLKDLDTYLGDKEWFIGNYVTWADFYWDICSTTLLVLKPDLLDIHPRLASLRKKVQALPAIAAWVQKRPQTKL